MHFLTVYQAHILYTLWSIKNLAVTFKSRMNAAGNSEIAHITLSFMNGNCATNLRVVASAIPEI